MEKCRICLAKVDLQPLFSCLTVTASARHQRKLKRATGLKIKQNDGLPQMICAECNKLLESALYLRKISLLSERKLLGKPSVETDKVIPKRLRDLRCTQYVGIDNDFEFNSSTVQTPIPDLKFIPFVDIDDHLEVNSQMIPLSKQGNSEDTSDNVPSKLAYAESIQLLSTNQDSALNKKRRSTKTSKGKNKKNSLQNRDIYNVLSSVTNTNNKNLKSLKLEEKIKKCAEFSDGALAVDGPIKCKVCKRLCNSLSSFSFHLRIHMGFDHICEFCGKKFYAAIGLKRHCMSWHGVEKELSCVHCNYQATSSFRLMEHERTHTGERPYECAECGGTFHARASIVQHLRLHLHEKTVQCDKCPSMFKNRRALTTHINQSHVRDYLYLCYMCDKRYSKNTTARRHLARTHGVPRDRQGKIPRFSLSKSAVVN